MLNCFLLLLHIILPVFLECLALKLNIDLLIEAYKLTVILQNLFTLYIAYIRKIDLYITNFQSFCLAHIVFKKEI